MNDQAAPSSASPGGPRFTAARLAGSVGIALAAWVAVILACSMIGQTELTWRVWNLRMLRLIPASLVGAGLSVAGVALQSLLRNPLASPEILGISSGSAVGAMIFLLAEAASTITPAALGGTTGAAALGGLAATAIVYGVAQRRGKLDPYTLLLSGVIVTAFNGAIIMFLYLLASESVIKDISVWAMGQVREQSQMRAVAVTAAVILAGWGVLLAKAKAFNVQSLGDEVAASVGVNVSALRIVTFVTAALMTAAAVALAGPIGFVGLIVPHITRRIFGADHRTLIITAGFVGACFLAGADTFCRSIRFRAGELPVGIITAMTGGPFFIYLLRRRFKEATL